MSNEVSRRFILGSFVQYSYNKIIVEVADKVNQINLTEFTRNSFSEISTMIHSHPIPLSNHMKHFI